MSSLDEIETNISELNLFDFLFVDENSDLYKKYKHILNQYSKLKKTPKIFNSIFSSYGWIATDDMSVPLMEKAISIAQNGNIDKAEDYICDSLTDEYFENNLNRMHAIWVFKERTDLIKLAFIDHTEERYHSSVPVILSQIDGLMYDIANQSFYEQGKKLDKFKIKSQITGLQNELDCIAKKMNISRSRTNCSPLSFPYRNGILHGRDIAYNNQLVSSKCFFNLFALRPWALFIQQNELKKRQCENYIEIPNLTIGKKLSDYLDWLIAQ